MSGQTARKKTHRYFGRRTAPPVTVQPREHAEQISFDPDDVYASMFPEDLGEYALRSATQSGYPPADSDAHGIGAIAVSDVALNGERFEDVSDEDLWAETMDLAGEYGAWAELRAGNPFEWEEASGASWSRDVDLHQARVVEASLFDPGSEETVHETRKPRIFADDDSPEHTQLVRRGRQRPPSARRIAR